ncbi:MAG: hypothetical protein ACHQHP_03815, partial [Bacteroidia bacterium]
MKTHFTLLVLSAVLSVKTFAQCAPAIPSAAIVITTTQTTSGTSKSYWVCKGATLTTSGTSEKIYLESGAAVNGSGTAETVYAPAGATVTLNSTGGTVYYVNTVDLISVSGAGVAKTQCTAITYNYTNAPTNGC